MMTSYFRTQSVVTNEIKSDVELLKAIPRERLQALGKFLAEGNRLIRTSSSMKHEIDTFLRGNPITGEQFAIARRLAMFMVQACAECDDEPAALIDDIDGVAPLQHVRDMLSALPGAVLRAVAESRAGALATSGIPALSGMSYVCDVRVDFRRFDAFYDDPGSRAEEPRGWIPVVLLRFGTDEKASLACQADLRTLQRAIRSLQAAERDLMRVHEILRKAELVSEA